MTDWPTSSQETRCLQGCFEAEGTSKLWKVVAGEGEGEGAASSSMVVKLTESTLLVICLNDLIVLTDWLTDKRGITSPPDIDTTGGVIISWPSSAPVHFLFMKSQRCCRAVQGGTL